MNRVDKHGSDGFLVPGIEGDLPGYHDPYYDPIWAAAVDLDLPASVHGGP